MAKSRWLALTLVSFMVGREARGLGPTNCLVIVNSNDPESLAVANAYRERRQIPDRNFVFLDYKGDKSTISIEEFDANIRAPVLTHIQQKDLTKQIAVWVTTTGFPHVIGKNSLSGVIYFGAEHTPVNSPEMGPAGFPLASGYFGSMQEFKPATGATPQFLHMRLDAGGLEATLRMIDRSVQADGTHPKGVVHLCDGVGPRESRKISIPPTVRFLQTLEIPVVHHENTYFFENARNVLGIYTGTWDFPLRNVEFVPGALADHLTSLGGALHNPLDQMLCTVWLKNGCSATYGTVVEPYNYPMKFPTAMMYAYYALGFSAVETYWMSVQWPQQGLFMGDPLTRPFGSPPTIALPNLKPGQTLAATASIDLDVVASDIGAGVADVDVYLDDRPAGTMVPPPIPPDTTVTLRIGEKQFQYKTRVKEGLANIVSALKRELSALPGDVEVKLNASNILILDGNPNSDLPKIEAESSSPTVQVSCQASRAAKFPTANTWTTWRFKGQGRTGDVVTLDFFENGQPAGTLAYNVARDLSANNLVLLVANQMRDNLPKGYSIRAEPEGPDDPLCGLRLEAGKEALERNPAAALRIKKGADSDLGVTNDGKVFPFTNTQDKTGNIAWLRFGRGPRRLKRKIELPTVGMADGMHTIRVVAAEGSGAAAESTLVVPFIVKNGPATLALQPLLTQLPLGAAPTKCLRATVAGGEPTGGVDFKVDGQPAGKVDAAPFELILDPKRHGVGKHRVTARTKVGDKDLLSSNDVVVEIRAE